MELEIDLASVTEREHCLTVVRGCLGTVVSQWDRLDDQMKSTLLKTGLDKVEALVRNLEQDIRPLRVSRSDPGSGAQRVVALP